MEDPNYEQTDIFAFMMEKPAGKKQRVRTRKAAPSSEQKVRRRLSRKKRHSLAKEWHKRRSRLA